MKAPQLTLFFGCLAAVVLYSTPVVKADETQQTAVESKLLYKVNEADITEQCLKSTEIQLQDVSWTIEMCKVKQNKEKEEDKYNLNIFLVPDLSKETSKWSVEASAYFLLKKDSENKTGKFENQKLTAGKKGEIRDFAEWEQFKSLSVDGVASFEITLKINPPTRVSPLEQVSTTFHFTVPDVTAPKGARSNDVILRGIRWYLSAFKTKENGADTFGIYLYANQTDMLFNYQWNVKANFALLTTNKDGKVWERNIEHLFHWRDSAWGYQNFIDWNTLTDKTKGYVVDNGAIFKVDLDVFEPQLLSPSS